MTDKEVEDIIRSNMNLQMNLAGIRADFEEKLQRTWVGLTDEDKHLFSSWLDHKTDDEVFTAIEAKLRSKNHG